MNTVSSDDKLFSVEVMRGIFLISDQLMGPDPIGTSLAPGNPTGSSYLVEGSKKALLIDLAVDDENLKDYAGGLTQKPLQLVLTHGHIDHTFSLNKFDDVWMHPGDEKFIREGMLGLPPANPCPEIHYLADGDSVDLGDRILDVLHLPGHSPGSIALLDRKTRTLISGDTCARRLLYGLTDYFPITDFLGNLRRLLQLDFDVIYTAHDRCALPKAHIENTIRYITDELPAAQKIFDHPGLEPMLNLVHGDMFIYDYFDMAVPVRYMETIRKELSER